MFRSARSQRDKLTSVSRCSYHTTYGHFGFRLIGTRRSQRVQIDFSEIVWGRRIREEKTLPTVRKTLSFCLIRETGFKGRPGESLRRSDSSIQPYDHHL